MTYHDIQNKDIGVAKSKRRIRTNDNDDLADQVKALQKAFANERGISEQYRQESLAILRVLLERRYP